jgi:glucose/arabinose dehydrogenase
VVLLDIVVHPDYATNGWIYISYASTEARGGNTKIIRAKLENESLTAIDLFTNADYLPRDNILALELLFDNAGYLYFSAGERCSLCESARSYETTEKNLPPNADGSIPKDNPFVGVANAKAIYTYVAIRKE